MFQIILATVFRQQLLDQQLNHGIVVLFHPAVNINTHVFIMEKFIYL